MKIDVNTKISSIIKHDKRAIDAIASVNAHFNKLKNPILRKVLAPRVTIADAARIGKCSVEDFFNVLAELGFEVETHKTNTQVATHVANERIEYALKNDRVQTLDVRPILEKGSDPFEHIQDAFQDLEEGYVLEIVNSFEPTPMIKIMEGKGVECMVKSKEDVVLSYFLKGQEIEEEAVGSLNMLSEEEMNERKEKFGEKAREIDVRHLEMPEPMVSILREVEKLDFNEALFVHHKKVPQYLLPELEQRKLKVHILDNGANNVKLLIHF